MLISDKEEKYGSFPTTLNFAVRSGKPKVYTLQNHFEVFRKFAPPGGYKECAKVCFAYMEMSSSFIKKFQQNRS